MKYHKALHQAMVSSGVKNLDNGPAQRRFTLNKMVIMKIMLFFIVMISASLGSCAQTSNVKDQKAKHVGGVCEGCEAIYESPIPFEKLNNIDTLPDFNGRGPKIEISGFIYKQDGKTPAADVVLYVYHTDQTGV